MSNKVSTKGNSGACYTRVRRVGERMVVVLDYEYVFKGITEWSPKWKHHGWRLRP